MKVALRATFSLLGALALALPLAAQHTGGGGGGGGDVTPPGTGSGDYGGPGDTVPGQPGGGGTPGGERRTPPKPPGSGAPVGDTGSPYAGGADPLAPRIPPPGSGAPGSGGAPPKPPTPASRPLVENPNSWQLWWHYNRWAHLDVGSTLSSTGTGGFYLGRGEREQESPLLRASRAQKRDIVQPALVQALRSGGNSDFQVFTLHALAKLREVPFDESLGDFLTFCRPLLLSGNQTVSEKAVLALGIRGEDRHLSLLVSILRDTPEGRTEVGRSRVGPRLRTFAAYGLGLLAERTRDVDVRLRIYDTLVEALWIERVEVQAACLLALGLTPMPLDMEYVDSGESFSGKTRVDQVLELVAFFEDPEQDLVARSQAPNALARLAVGASESIRARAAYTLLVATGPHSKEAREIQNGAVIALGQIGRSGPEPIDAEIRAQLARIAYKSSANRSTRYLAMVALAEAASRRGHGEEPFLGVESARKVFLRYLGRSRGETQAWTALAIGILEEDAAARGEVASPETAKALRHIFQRTRSHEVAGALAIAIGMTRDAEAEELLHDRLIHAGEQRVRAYTALALGMMGARSTLPAIRGVLAKSSYQPFVLENCAIALALLGDQETGSTLYTILEQSSSPQVQSSIASAMGWIKDPRPVSQLCDLLVDNRKNDTARAWTAVAIGRICDDDKWPWVGRLSVNANFDMWLSTLADPAFHAGLLDLP